MIGNAVPIPLAKVLGRELLKSLFSKSEKGSIMPLLERHSASESVAKKETKKWFAWAYQAIYSKLNEPNGSAGIRE
jgi:hypothetical protein